jgi:hypothetical protein
MRQPSKYSSARTLESTRTRAIVLGDPSFIPPSKPSAAERAPRRQAPNETPKNFAGRSPARAREGRRRQGKERGEAQNRGRKNHSTRDSHVVPHHGTNRAVLRLTAQIGRDAVLSESYGRGYITMRPRAYVPHTRAWGAQQARPAPASTSYYTPSLARRILYTARYLLLLLYCTSARSLEPPPGQAPPALIAVLP